MPDCSHTHINILDATDRLVYRAQLINMLEQHFPQANAYEIDQVLNSDDFEYARCSDCTSFLVRLA